MWPPVLALACALVHVDQSAAGTPVRMGNQNDRVRAFIREVEAPDVELILHSGPSRLQPLSSASSSSAFCGVRNLAKLPRGKASSGSACLSLRPRISPS